MAAQSEFRSLAYSGDPEILDRLWFGRHRGLGAIGKVADAAMHVTFQVGNGDGIQLRPRGAASKSLNDCPGEGAVLPLIILLRKLVAR
jgi:hypothetical protein